MSLRKSMFAAFRVVSTCGLCVSTCPDVFSMTDAGVAVAIDADVPEGSEDTAAEAKDGCPVSAIEEA